MHVSTSPTLSLPRFRARSIRLTSGDASRGQIGLNTWQTYRILYAASELSLVLRSDVRGNMVVCLLIGWFNVAAAGFFARRAWLVSACI